MTETKPPDLTREDLELIALALDALQAVRDIRTGLHTIPLASPSPLNGDIAAAKGKVVALHQAHLIRKMLEENRRAVAMMLEPCDMTEK